MQPGKNLFGMEDFQLRESGGTALSFSLGDGDNGHKHDGLGQGLQFLDCTDNLVPTGVNASHQHSGKENLLVYTGPISYIAHFWILHSEMWNNRCGHPGFHIQ